MAHLFHLPQCMLVSTDLQFYHTFVYFVEQIQTLLLMQLKLHLPKAVMGVKIHPMAHERTKFTYVVQIAQVLLFRHVN